MGDDRFVERDAFGTVEANNSRADLTDLVPENTQDYTDATFDYNGPDINERSFDPAYNDTYDEEVELTTDEIINYICMALGKKQNLIYQLSKPEKLESALQGVSDKIEQLTGVKINVVNLFRTDTTVKAAIQLIGRGIMCYPTFEHVYKDTLRFVFLPDVNNIHVTVDAFGKGLHKYKNKLAVTSFDERILGKAKKFLNSLGVMNFRDLLDRCKDIEIYKPPIKPKASVSKIRALSKKDLAESVLNNELTINDLKRAGIDNKIIQSVAALM